MNRVLNIFVRDGRYAGSGLIGFLAGCGRWLCLAFRRAWLRRLGVLGLLCCFVPLGFVVVSLLCLPVCLSFCVVAVMPAVVRFHCPFVGLSGCQDGGGNGLTCASMLVHLRDRHCCEDAQATTRHSLSTSLAVFSAAEITFKRMGRWLCGVCLKTHPFRSVCRHGRGSDFVAGPDCGDGVIRFVLHGLPRPMAPPLASGVVMVPDSPEGFTVTSLDRLLSLGLRTVKSIPHRCRLGFSRVFKGALDAVISSPADLSCWVRLFVMPLCLLKTFSARSSLECRAAVRRQRQEESIANAIRSWGEPGGICSFSRKPWPRLLLPLLWMVT